LQHVVDLLPFNGVSFEPTLDLKVQRVRGAVDAGYVKVGERNEVDAGTRGGPHDSTADESPGTPNGNFHY
jgi:hypothetical protein